MLASSKNLSLQVCIKYNWAGTGIQRRETFSEKWSTRFRTYFGNYIGMDEHKLYTYDENENMHAKKAWTRVALASHSNMIDARKLEKFGNYTT